MSMDDVIAELDALQYTSQESDFKALIALYEKICRHAAIHYLPAIERLDIGKYHDRLINYVFKPSPEAESLFMECRHRVKVRCENVNLNIEMARKNR